MKNELFVLRHGKSDWDTNETDFNRPLKKRGKKNAQQIALWMIQEKLFPDYIISSPAERALATTLRICKILSIHPDKINLDKRILIQTKSLIAAKRRLSYAGLAGLSLPA